MAPTPTSCRGNPHESECEKCEADGAPNSWSGPETLLLAGERCRVHEHEDGRIELRRQGQLLPCRAFVDPEPRVLQADIVGNKRLGAVLAQIQKNQQERDRARLASRKLTLR